MRFRARRQGQALVVAVTILFILLALALLFLRNALFHVQSTGISNERIADVTLAHSGVDFVDHELMNSPLGADWRPAPRNLSPGGADPVIAALDPDFQYLRPWAPVDSAPVTVLTYKGQPVVRSLMGPSGGFTRLNFGQGRALIRVTYNPRNALSFNGMNLNLPLATDLPAANRPPVNPATNGPWTEYGPTPLSLYMRIDSIGRFGDTAAIDNSAAAYGDPTLVVNAGLDRPYRVQQVAYKAFGLGDHLLFVTNKNKEGNLFDIGYAPSAVPAPLTPTTLFNETPGGVPGDTHGAQFIAGDLFVNGTAMWNQVDAHINPPLLGSGVHVAGSTMGSLAVNNGAVATTQSQPTGLLDAMSLVLDNNWFNNAQASTRRSVRRLQSPPLDLDRYRALTRDSRGSGFYIDNPDHLQPQIGPGEIHSSQDLGLGPQSWFNPYNPPAQDANSWGTVNGGASGGSGNPGYTYVPPVVKMVFHHPGLLSPTDPDSLHAKYYFIRIFRDGSDPAPQERTWPWPVDGTDSGSNFIDVYYTPDAAADPAVQAAFSGKRMLPDASGQMYPAPVAVVTDHTIMAEGNLAIHGDVAPGLISNWGVTDGGQLAVVSRGTIYLDGSLNRAVTGTGTPQDVTRYYNGAVLTVPSAVALMAQDHVVVNLTLTGTRVQYWDWNEGEDLQLDRDIPASDPDNPGASGGGLPSALHWKFDPNRSATERHFRITFSLANVPPNTPVRLYFRHSVQTANTPQHPEQDTTVDAYLNPPAGAFNPSAAGWMNCRILKNGSGGLPPAQQSVTPLVVNSGGTEKGKWEYSSYLLPSSSSGTLNYGGDNVIDFYVEGDNYYLSRVAVKAIGEPEAVVNVSGAFLANDGGFYVIPKDWFYFNPPAGVPTRRQPDDPMPQQPDVPVNSPNDYSANYQGNNVWAYDTTYPGYIGNGGPPATTVPDPGGIALGQQVLVNGSLTVNALAPSSQQAYWATYDPYPVSLDGLNAPGPLFTFDDSFIDIAPREGRWLPLMPRLPMVPGLVYEGESSTL